MLREIRELGFEYAELSHGIRMSLLPGVLDAVAAGEIKISTLHNFCPLPLGVNHPAPNLYRFTATDSRERESAFRHTVRTLETASRVNAQLVVLHMGSVDMSDYTEKLIDLLGEDRKGTTKYEKLCADVIQKREQRKQVHLDLAYELLDRIVEQAAHFNVKLGIENREALEEIPFETDFSIFFKRFTDPRIGYWHDTGHAQIKANLGFIDHAMHLQAMAPRLHGFHIHDVRFPAADHCPPGSGMIDFAALKPFVKPEHIKVFELHPAIPVEDAQRGVAYLKGIWGGE
jgi:sugar phosphate isomerase/epimerase